MRVEPIAISATSNPRCPQRTCASFAQLVPGQARILRQGNSTQAGRCIRRSTVCGLLGIRTPPGDHVDSQRSGEAHNMTARRERRFWALDVRKDVDGELALPRYGPW